MKNLWSVSDDCDYARWRADLTGARHYPQAVLSWMVSVVEAGEKCKVLTVLQAPRSGFQRDRDGALGPFLKRRFEESGRVDLFYFMFDWSLPYQGEVFQSTAWINFFDSGGGLAEAEVVGDLSRLLRQLRPEYGDWHSLCRRGLPLRIMEPAGPYDHPQFKGVNVQFILQTDIWFPWLHRAREIMERADFSKPILPACRNLLALHHTPRLNSFLAAVRDETTRVGGNWELYKDICSDLFMLDDNGIRLDGELPTNYVEVQV